MTNKGDIEIYEIFRILRKRIKLIIILIILSLCLAAVFNFAATSEYEGSFVVKIVKIPQMANTANLPTITNFEIERLVLGLNDLINQNNNKELSAKLNLPEERSKAITKLICTTPRGADEFVEITIDVCDYSIIAEVKNAILNYLNREVLFNNTRMKLLRDYLLQDQVRLQEKINELDKLSRFLLTRIKKGDVKYLGFNPLLLEQSISEFNQRQIVIKDQLRVMDGLQIAMDSTVVKKVKPKMTLNFIIAGFGALFIGIILSLMIEGSKNKSSENCCTPDMHS